MKDAASHSHRFILFLLISLAFGFSGCISFGVQEYINEHPELSAEEIKYLKRYQVRPGQTTGMVKAMLGTPFRQARPGQAKDILFYWKPNEPAPHPGFGTAPKTDEERLNQTLNKAVEVMEKAIRDERGTLRIIYFMNGRVSHEEIRPNVYPSEVDKVTVEGFLS